MLMEIIKLMDFLLKKNIWIFWILFQKKISILDDHDPNKFVAKMGAECIMDLLARIDLDELVLRIAS
jgi:DNA-directed RNA polymerase subunit beta'